MSAKADSTKRRILESAKTEFLSGGFSGASLRVIARNAGVTTGALYGYFADKDSLFEELVGKHVDYFQTEFRDAHAEFWKMNDETQLTTRWTIAEKGLFRLVEYMYDHLDAFSLALRCSAGTRFENWLDPVIEIEEESTRRFICRLRAHGYPVKDITDELVHILCSGFFHGVMEPIIHGMDRASAMRYIALLREYSTAGWSSLFGISIK